MPRILPFAIWALITVGLLAASGLVFWRDAAFRKRSLPMSGEIVSTSDGRDSSTGARYYTAVVQWTDRDGAAHEFNLRSSSAYTKGRSVDFRYDPANPKDHRSGSTLRIVGFGLGFVGLVFLGILIRMLFLL